MENRAKLQARMARTKVSRRRRVKEKTRSSSEGPIESGGIKLDEGGAARSALDGERLLALSSLLKKGSREFEFFLHGKSMGPSLPDGSWIRVRTAADDQFMAGQVLTYVVQERVVAHRLERSVKSGNQLYLITRGDATVCCDWPLPATSVVGIVIGFSNAGLWKAVGPPPKRWFGFRCLALLILSLVTNILRVSPTAAVWTAKRIIRIHRIVQRVMGYFKRVVAVGSPL